ncbi:beta-carotene isomerase D27, chloroplastic isoform X4 [Cornus florida]|uniref:beta-carotene isomerase D27, chloroplastic isoform X4 n=1 Tax=Cornus florida TaxID=4283 RepID=UPI0028984B05|nr:beta-carotene isomerase D27, chloroplastic isoform X4 [Cornus florida]XP_059659403.1 beta-carotene isomerase D27, chloroplastic isoform X4 [Cornus florida]XP_059659404.1 beta-carotene isomerase D27, chloroplastic isoform X4 [Cornus florida]
MAMAVLGTGFTLSFSSSPLSPSHHRFLQPKFHCQNPSFRVSCSMKDTETDSRAEYKPGMLDDLFLNLFRNKMVQEVGWDSEKPGYNGLIEVANHLMTGRSNSETKEAAVRILKSLFPPFLLELYRILITPIGGGKVSAMMVARVTALSCQWLMGPCTVNSVDLPDGSSCKTGVFVERCKYLEESKCVGICINTCKLPTQTFFKDYMGVPLLMEPNFSDYSCQFKFGVILPLLEDDSTLREPCLEICPNATRCRESTKSINLLQCPKA